MKTKKEDYHTGVGLAVDVLQGVPSIVIGIVVYFWVVKPLGLLGSFRKHCFGYYDAADHHSFYRRNIKIDSRYFERSRICFRNALSSCHFKNIGALRNQRNSFPAYCFPLQEWQAKQRPYFYCFWKSLFQCKYYQPDAMPYHMLIYKYAISPYNDWHDLAWGAAFILLIHGFIIKYHYKADYKKRWKVQL